MPLALAIGSAVPAGIGNVSELVEWMRANPKLANVGSPGVGSLPHLLEAMLFRQADVPWQHVAYSGGAPAVVALLGGQIAALILPEAVLARTVPPQVACTRHVGTAAQRLHGDVPTLSSRAIANWWCKSGSRSSCPVGCPRPRSTRLRNRCAWRSHSRSW